MNRRFIDGENIFTIDEFLSAEECEHLIDQSEALGFQTATFGGHVVRRFRDNARVILDDADLAEVLWLRAMPFLPAQIDECQATGFNPRFRFYRYTGSESFRAHYDGVVRIGEEQESKLTFMVYLCDVAKGGETRFCGPGGIVRFAVRPEQGKALVFNHRELHEAVAVKEGGKYVLRTDVMYSRLPRDLPRNPT